MSKVYRLEYSIFEPMLFRSSGEFDPSARGVQVHASSLLLPSPSTIAGALASLVFEKTAKSLHGESWVEEYLSILGSDVALRCPFMEVEDELYVGDEILGALVKLEVVIEKVRMISRILHLKESRDMNDIASMKECLRFFEDFQSLRRRPELYIPSSSERVGVGLKVRSKGIKAVEEEKGLLYSVSFIDYSLSKASKVKIVADAKGKVFEEVFKDSLVAPIRLGGEGRVSLLTISSGTSILNRLKRKVWNGLSNFTGYLGLYVCSPVLFRCGSPIKDSIKYSIGSRGLSLKMVYGEVEVRGAGFSLARRKRKPIYSSIKPGSIIFTEAENCDLEKLYWSGFGGIGVEVGYGTVIPVPV